MTLLACIRAERLALAAELETLSTESRLDAVEMAAIDSGGSVVPPSKNGWGPHDFTVSLLGITQSGDTAEAAIKHWICSVIRMERAMQEEEGKAA
ncbi:hypothetical protein ATO6_15465 [Oceanicola sp. 22II-s10i]|uniref:hypothetical protein n=1 Tax=Oceanicola sp. 22II-s10i TaxID=1317116 RepID=UPI000B528AFF|nr:hypothetical protein [Oceanicola sp. 22II-s10i]OWU83826.1 hypothetical protein ATO6_15465 [Oceanicola sp. 22II-s10i]